MIKQVFIGFTQILPAQLMIDSEDLALVVAHNLALVAYLMPLLLVDSLDVLLDR